MPPRKKDPETGEELLTVREYLFVEYYLGAAQNNATQAALMAGYSTKTAHEIGRQNLEKLEIQKRIEIRLAQARITTDEVLRRVADRMRGDVADFVDFTKTGFKLNLQKAEKLGKTHLIKKLSFNKQGKPMIELYSSFDAEKLLCDILGLKKMPQANPVDEQVKVERAIEQFMKETGCAREDAVKYLAPLMPEVSKYVN